MSLNRTYSSDYFDVGGHFSHTTPNNECITPKEPLIPPEDSSRLLPNSYVSVLRPTWKHHQSPTPTLLPRVWTLASIWSRVRQTRWVSTSSSFVNPKESNRVTLFSPSPSSQDFRQQSIVYLSLRHIVGISGEGKWGRRWARDVVEFLGYLWDRCVRFP